MNNHNRLIIDITQLVHWPGRLTGIPRVMNEISIRYAESEGSVFVTWSSQDNCFYELDIQRSLSQRGEGIFYKENTSSDITTSKISSASSGWFYNILKKSIRKAKNINPVLYGKITSRLSRYVKNRANIITPGLGDTLFVLWGEWSDGKYRDAVILAQSSQARLVHVVYDILPIITPQYSGHSTVAMRDYYSRVIPVCDLVLSISESTKIDLMKWLQELSLPIPKIETFRLGDDFQQLNPEPPPLALSALQIDGEICDYILCVGTIEARKNHTLLYYAYKLAAQRGVKLPKMVVVGRRGWKTDDIFDIIGQDPDTSTLFEMLTDVSDEELSWLYSNCRFTIYPSFYEGWGLPIAESIAYGKPCISSNTSSMPEIAGELISYFSPMSSDECLKSIIKLLDDNELKLATKRISKYKITSWDDTYQQIISSLEELHVKVN